MPRAIKGVLIECDASIKAIISKIDADRHEIIIEDLDEMHLLVKEGKLEELKLKLADVLKESQSMFQYNDSGSD